MQLKVYKYIIAIYSAVLLASLALFYILPKEGLFDLALDSSSAAEREMYRDTAIRGELDRLEGLEPYKQWCFDYTGDCLEITSDKGSDPSVMVKRTAAVTDKITAAEYRLNTFLAAELKPYRINLEGNGLSVAGPGRLELKFRELTRDFTANQFRGEKSAENHEKLFQEFEFIQQLYLLIPAGVEVEYDPEMFIYFMDEE